MADDPRAVLPDLPQLLRDLRKLGPEFNKALREGNIDVAQFVVRAAASKATTNQEVQVARGLTARKDRIPKIAVKNLVYKSSSRPTARRSQDARPKLLDIFFGAEFGGGKYGRGNPTTRQTRGGRLVRKGGGYTTQFKPHRGRQGYFLYPTIRDNRTEILRLYAANIEDVRRRFNRGSL